MGMSCIGVGEGEGGEGGGEGGGGREGGGGGGGGVSKASNYAKRPGDKRHQEEMRICYL